MEVKVIGITVDGFNSIEENIKILEELKKNSNFNDIIDSGMVLGGREAGICYMAENYFSDKINNSEAALRRSNVIIGSGHHSPFDHFYINLEISNLPKIMAMILNSTEYYTTSEKSGRYTVMKPKTQIEQDVYDKWHKIFAELIHNYLPEKTDKEVDKLALENARYLTSVFTPTSMGYSTSLRQLSYMTKWLYDLYDITKDKDNDFDRELSEHAKEMADALNNIVGRPVPDNKNGSFRFLVSQYDRAAIDNEEIIGDIYQVTYLASFTQLAQAQRHRTLHYEMEFNGVPGINGCYIPELLKNTEYESEWLKDFDTVKGRYPQCTLVKVLEQGTAHNFFLKCKERLCARAQLEISLQTIKTMEKFIDADNVGKLCTDNHNELANYIKNGKVVAKCQFTDFKCTEPCSWGPKGAFTRLI